MLVFYSYKKYEGSKKATGYSMLLHNWPFTWLSWLCGTIGLFISGVMCFGAFEIEFLIAFLMCLAFLWYAIVHKKLLEKKIVLALYRDCPDIFNKEELSKLKKGTKEDIRDVVKALKERNRAL